MTMLLVLMQYLNLHTRKSSMINVKQKDFWLVCLLGNTENAAILVNTSNLNCTGEIATLHYCNLAVEAELKFMKNYNDLYTKFCC